MSLAKHNECFVSCRERGQLFFINGSE